MGKNKSCTPELRKVILNLIKDNWTYGKIAQHLNCSKKMVFNAVQYVKKNKTAENVPRKSKPRKTSANFDGRIIRMAKVDPKRTAVDIHKELFDGENGIISIRTIRRRLNEANLYGRVARKKPLVNKRNRERRLQFAKDHINWSTQEWKRILFTDETKINRLGSDGKQYVRRPPKCEYNPNYTTITLKHGGGNVVIWGCFSWRGVGPIHRVKGIMDQYMYINILENILQPYADEFMPVTWKLVQDNDPKHTAKSVKQWLINNSVSIIDWPSCSPDLNPIENLWGAVKQRVRQRQFKNLDELYEAVREAWYSIPVELCQTLISSMGRRCAEVIKNHGYPTKY